MSVSGRKSVTNDHHPIPVAWSVAVFDPSANKVDGRVTLHAFAAGIAPPLFVRDLFWREDIRITGENSQAEYVAMQPIAAGSGTACEALRTFVMSAQLLISSSMAFHKV